MSTPYDNYAFGVAVGANDVVDYAKLKEMGFSIVMRTYADDMFVSPIWAEEVQKVWDAGLPLLAEVIPFMAAVGYSQGKLAESYWNQFDYPYIDRSETGIDRKVAGIVISAERETDGNEAKVTEGNTKATLEYLFNNYRAKLDAAGKTDVKVMLRSRDSYIQNIAPSAIPNLVGLPQFNEYFMADWRFRREVPDDDGKLVNQFAPIASGVTKINSVAGVKTALSLLPVDFKTPLYPGKLYFWELGKWWKMDAVKDAAGSLVVPRVFVVYTKTEQQLYADLKFVPKGSNPLPPPPVGKTVEERVAVLETEVADLNRRVELLESAPPVPPTPTPTPNLLTDALGAAAIAFAKALGKL